ncbi:response regulator [Catenuloplanes atrovinosus]|uniref:Two-component system chemotaxis response regulator CheY n=1 Tax=Catenuloplanes atrovinosus TaxID=137266 RepID=A0AAE4CAL8_9ACTN|nr:response regulator [Catenuloplanes atrovinosus]MDR7277137.1 two-component system chemotaxis response regulator CheY [Catenuloplanes atrovinosus]
MAHVIAAEDEPEIQQILRMILERAGHTVTVVGDGADVVDAVGEHRPDLVLLDLGLPHVGGLDICRALREDPATSTLPVGVVSGQITPPFTAAFAAGATAVLAKPFTRAQLLELVDTLLTAPSAPP